jgi:MATE family multidrug resistance protein
MGLLLGAVSMATWSMIFAFFPRFLARVFTPKGEIIESAVALIRIAALFQLFDGAQVVAAGALPRWPLVANVLTHWCVGLPLGCVLAFVLHRGAPGLWYGLTTGLVFVGTSLTWRFFRLTRREIARL